MVGFDELWDITEEEYQQMIESYKESSIDKTEKEGS